MFLQIHFLTHYTGVLLNRDDVGFAKRMPVGNATRTRVSSQCLKRHWRRHEGPAGIRSIDDAELAVRSRESFDVMVKQKLVEAGTDADIALELTAQLMELIGMKADKKKLEAKEEPRAFTGQVTVLGPRELEYLGGEALEIAKELGDLSSAKPTPRTKAIAAAVKARAKDRDWKKNIQALGAGLDVAMFGRMVTGDVFAGTDAAIHVAHAFTVHGELSESDYFSAVDDLLEARGEVGSGHINTQELTSGLFYGYVVVDLPLLVANLTGGARAEWRSADRSLAAEVVARLVESVATVSPGAKLGSTAPYGRSSFLCLESTEQLPCSYADAFVDAVPTNGNLLAEAFRAVSDHVHQLDETYGFGGQRRYLAIGPRDALEGLGEPGSLDELTAFAREVVTA